MATVLVQVVDACAGQLQGADRLDGRAGIVDECGPPGGMAADIERPAQERVTRAENQRAFAVVGTLTPRSRQSRAARVAAVVVPPTISLSLLTVPAAVLRWSP